MINAGHITARFAVLVLVLVLAGVGVGAPSPVWASAPAAGSSAPAPGVTVSSVLRQAIERALAAPGSRLDSAVEERGSRAGDCRASEAQVPRAVEGSGRVAVKITGRTPRGAGCEVWIWVRVRVLAPVAVAKRALRAGDRLDDAVVTEERELHAGHAPGVIGPASVAARTIGAGQMIESAEISEPTLRPGEPVKVLVVSGALTIEQAGRAVPCARGRSCATLSSGRHVEGDLVNGQLVVQSQ